MWDLPGKLDADTVAEVIQGRGRHSLTAQNWPASDSAASISGYSLMYVAATKPIVAMTCKGDGAALVRCRSAGVPRSHQLVGEAFEAASQEGEKLGFYAGCRRVERSVSSQQDERSRNRVRLV